MASCANVSTKDRYDWILVFAHPFPYVINYAMLSSSPQAYEIFMNTKRHHS